jgi:hypothetical protein
LAHGNINIASTAVGTSSNASSALLIFWGFDSSAEGLFMAATQCLFREIPRFLVGSQKPANEKRISPTDIVQSKIL